MHKSDLENRLIEFTVHIIELIHLLPETKTANHLSGQLLRSSTSVSLNYGEAQSGESRKDFIHKMKIVLKELRESYICLKIINQSKDITCDKENIRNIINEANELISIFVKSVSTAQKNETENKKIFSSKP